MSNVTHPYFQKKSCLFGGTRLTFWEKKKSEGYEIKAKEREFSIYLIQ